MSTPAELCLNVPAVTRGRPIGIYGPVTGRQWRMVVEVALPATTVAQWGTAKWGTAKWGSRLTWWDVTEWWAGATWQRGADSIGGRPRVGTATLQLLNPGWRFSRWNTSTPHTGQATTAKWFGPGTLIRFGLLSHIDGTGILWHPLFTGVVETWDDVEQELETDPRVEIVAAETLSFLASVDEAELPALVGGGESATARVGRLLDAAKWPYPRELVASTVPMQSTNMAQNRLAELYVTADSADLMLLSGRNGAAVLRSRAPRTPTRRYVLADSANALPTAEMTARGFHAEVLYEPGPTLFQDRTTVRNVLSYGRAGGEATDVQDLRSVARYGTQPYGRTDLLNASDTDVANVAKADLERMAWHRMNATATVNLALGFDPANVLDLLATYDVGDKLHLWRRPGRNRNAGAKRLELITAIASMSHRMAPIRTNLVSWSATYSLMNYSTEPVPGGGFTYA